MASTRKQPQTAPPAPLRAAVIGAGLMGRWHADAISRIGAKVVAIVDQDRRRATRLARRHPGAQSFTELMPLLDSGLADVAHICTPLETHEKLTSYVLRARMHALVEKPLASTSESTVELLRLALSEGVLLCPVHQFLFQAGILQACASLEAIAPLLHLDFVTCSAGADKGTARERQELVAEILVHPLSLASRLLGEGLGAFEWQVQWFLPGELRAQGLGGDVSLSLLVSTRGRPTANLLRIIGESGTIHVDLFHGFMVREGPAVSRAHKIAHPFAWSGKTMISAGANLLSRAMHSEVAYPGLRELVQRFYRAVQEGSEPPIGAQEILEVAVARDKIVRQICS